MARPGCFSISIAALILSAASLITSNIISLLNKQSFTLVSFIEVRQTKGGLVSISRIQESYSAEQRRAQLEFRLHPDHPARRQNDIKSGTFYFDANMDAALLFNSESWDCKLSSVGEFVQIHDLDSAAYRAAPTDSFVIGAARLLFYAAGHQDLVRAKAPELVRNILCDTFELVPSNQIMNVSVNYCRLDEISSILPARVVVELAEKVISVEYTQFKILDSDMRLAFQGGARLDRFAVEPVAGCSKALASKAEDLFASQSNSNVRFSFTASVQFSSRKSHIDFKTSFFVAYDSTLDSMRLVESGFSKQIINFKSNRIYHLLEAGVGSRSRGESSCIAAKVLPDSVYALDERPYSIGQLLVGVKGFVYMGRATVRGIDARVYEAHEGSLPFWLGRPMLYNTTRARTHLRQNLSPLDRLEIDSNSNVVIYLSGQAAKPTLLSMEVYNWDAEESLVYEKLAVSFFDFAWDIATEITTGDRLAELFSLSDLCSAGPGRNHYSSIELLLEGEDARTNITALNTVRSRNIAVLASLQQNLKLPATMITDLVAKPIKRGPSGKQSLSVSFKLTEHVHDLVEMVYLGRGRPSPVEMDLREVVASSFENCFFLAAHRQPNVHFGYEETNKCCYIHRSGVPGLQLSAKLNGFIIEKNGSFEIFRTNHDRDTWRSSLSSLAPTQTPSLSMQQFVGKQLNLGITAERRLLFAVKEVGMKDKDSKETSKQTAGAAAVWTSLGLVEQASQSRIVPPAMLSEKGSTIAGNSQELAASASILDRCREACLLDTGCQSYSVCIVQSEAQCIVSKVSFKSVDIIRQLEKALSTRIEIDKVSVLLNNSSSVRLVRHPNCELHNKVYLDMFGVPSRGIRVFTDRRIYFVSSREQCAEMCVRRSLNLILRADGGRLDAKLTSSEAATVRSQRKAVAKEICGVFMYLGRDVAYTKLAKRTRERLERRVSLVQAASVQLDDNGGYCLLGQQASKEEDEELAADETVSPTEAILFELHPFRFSVLYQREHGVRLKNSQLTAAEQAAYLSFRSPNGRVDETSRSTMELMLERSDNFQTPTKYDEFNCATMCYLQTNDLWPACRSFDVSIERGADGVHVASCQLNSLTLQQAAESKRFDLIEYGNHSTWHYEPRSEFFQLDERALDSSVSIVQLRDEHDSAGWSRVHAFGVFCTVLLGIITGVVCGIFVGRWNTRRLGEIERVRRVRESQANMTFCNAVNSEGAIYD